VERETFIIHKNKLERVRWRDWDSGRVRMDGKKNKGGIRSNGEGSCRCKEMRREKYEKGE